MTIQTKEIAQLAEQDIGSLMLRSRELYSAQICETAEFLKEHCLQTPIILLSGPSGSGKTTTAMVLERQLEHWGLETHTLSMDNYFSPLLEEEKELVRQHKMDLESPSRVDVPFLTEQLLAIAEGKPVCLPRYDFTTAERVFDGTTLQRRDGEVVIVEGIHALNPAVTGQIGDRAACVYVSVRTRVLAQTGRELHPSKIRLLRRMLRDNIFRARELADTIRMAPSVDRGEELYIMPYKNRARFHINTFIPYELCVYKGKLWQQLHESAEEFSEIADVIEVLRELPEIDESLVPRDALIREFIGGSIFNY